jgi:hypothetical protein
MYMKVAFQFLKKYPISIICYLLYTWLCYDTLIFNLAFQERLMHRKPDESGIMLGGEVMGYKSIFVVFIAGVFIFVCFANAIARKQNAFYLWLSLIIIVQTIVLFQIMK